VLALGFSQKGIDFTAGDGRPSRIVFLLLVPPRAPEREVRLLAAIAQAVITPERRTRLLAASTLEQVSALLGALPAPSLRSSRTSLADY
jgi:mannitol/fructose-specific phosphotransferase system IIA component (Ntr-type)